MEEILVNLEGPILLWIQEYLRVDFLTPVITFITHLGDGGRIWIACALLFLILPKTRKTGVVMAASMLLNLLATNIVLKNLFARTRPYVAVEGLHRMIEAQSDFSFPSGHTACSFAAAVVIFRLCPRKVGIPAIVLAVLISLSRLYVGVHFPTDVIGGAIIGTAAALFVCWVEQKRQGGSLKCEKEMHRKAGRTEERGD